MYHTYVTSYEELEDNLNNLSVDEEVFAINTVGTQAVVITKDKKDTCKAEELLIKRQKLLEDQKRIDQQYNCQVQSDKESESKYILYS